MQKNQNDVAKFLFCLSDLEWKAFLLYQGLSEKSQSRYVRSLLVYIAYSSLKDSVILQDISKTISARKRDQFRIKDKDYERILGEVWKKVRDLSNAVSKTEKIDDKTLASLDDRLGSIYTIISVQLKTLQFLGKEISKIYNVSLEDLQEIFELVYRDEQDTTEILVKIRDSCTPKIPTSQNPEVKYQAPDNWHKEPASQSITF